MKLPDFTQDVLMNWLRQQMGAALGQFTAAVNRDVLTAAEIEALTRQGLDVSLDEVRSLPDGTLAYKNNRVILYIRDVLQYGGNGGYRIPRYHVAECITLKEMREKNRFDRYIVANQDSGVFSLNIVGKGGGEVRSVSERLPVCQNCLSRLQWDGFLREMSSSERKRIVANFTLQRFFAQYGRSLLINLPTHTVHTAPLNLYTADFSRLGARIKAERGFFCDQCGVNLSSHKEFLHAHHKNGLKHDNRPENISILCIACHAGQYQHAHMKNTSDYREFMQLGLQARHQHP